MFEEDLTAKIIGAGIEVHRILGPGLLESAYGDSLCYELSLSGLALQREVDVPLMYKDLEIACGYRADVIVQGAVLLELKAVERVLPVHEAQLLTYLRLTGIRVGLLLNFNVDVLKKGIVRRVL